MGKKSKRRQVIKPMAKSKAAMMANSCTHGIEPVDPSDMMDVARATARKEALEGMLKSLQVVATDRRASFTSGMIAAMEYLDSLGLMDEHMLSCTVSLAVDKIINKRRKKDVGEAFACLQMAITMEYWLKVGREEFCSVMRTDDMKSRRKHPWFAEYQAASLNAASERDTVRKLAKRIPCDCLGAAKAECKNDAKMKMCHSCGKQFLDSELYVCSKCEIVRYCSDKCSSADWDNHKRFCKSVPKKSKS